jgi:fumarylpyruvate hydrolase
MQYVVDPSPISIVPVARSESLFPVHRIYCVGQNYGDHVREMGGDPKKGSPIFFSKPADAVVINNHSVDYPLATNNLHYEVELVVALASGGTNIGIDDAMSCVLGYAVGIDFTKRDLQAAAKEKGKPWDTAKGFDQSAPISAISLAEDVAEIGKTKIMLEVNGEVKQHASTEDMIWNVAEIIVELSKYYQLKAGDLIFTGTPSGVSTVQAGDHMRAAIDGVGELTVELK